MTGTPPYTYTVLYRPTGTTNWLTGPTVSTDFATIDNLSPGVSYDFEIIVRNQAGNATSPTVTAITSRVPPSPAQNLQATLVQATAITVAWTAPASGTPPLTYTINYRVTGTTAWQILAVTGGALTVTIIGLTASTEYDIEVVTSN
jgi:hypothetical protein